MRSLGAISLMPLSRAVGRGCRERRLRLGRDAMDAEARFQLAVIAACVVVIVLAVAAIKIADSL